MRALLILILSLSLTLTTIGQTLPDSLGFTNKIEAKNLKVNGLKEGKWIEYIEKGSDSNNPIRYLLTFYNHDQPVGIQREYFQKKLFKEITYDCNGVINGNQKEYYGSGTLYIEVPFTNNKKNGDEKQYYENGMLKRETFYVNGQPGPIKRYDKNGNEIK